MKEAIAPDLPSLLFCFLFVCLFVRLFVVAVVVVLLFASVTAP